jgi:hypothetical protein
MVEKLRSISKRIHWSSLLKALVFAAAWFLFPLWLFVLVALYLYFVPLSQSGAAIAPFFVLLVLMVIEPIGLFFAVIFGVVFFYVLLIKDLMLIDRKTAYEVTILFLAFLLFRDFYEKYGSSLDATSLAYSLGVALLVAALVSSFIRHFGSPGKEGTFTPRRIAVWLSTVLVWQFLLVGLFLPVDFIYQTVIVFLGSIFVIDLVPQYIFGEASRAKVLVTASVVFALFVLVLGSARWGL